MPKARLVIADDHAMFREGLAHLLPPEVELVAAVANGNEVLETARRLQPDLIVADLAMPGVGGGGGRDALRILRGERLHARFIILTVHADPAIAAQALRAGATAFVVKHAAA